MKKKEVENIETNYLTCCNWYDGENCNSPFFMNTELYFLSDKFGFSPLINREQLSIFNLELGMGVNITILIIINTVLLAALCFLQFRLYKKGLMNTHTHIILSLFIAGSICSIFDKLVFGGSLDYLLVYQWICDLKDIYICRSGLYGDLFSNDRFVLEPRCKSYKSNFWIR